MIYTPRLHAAIRFAVKTHEVYQKQKRKGKDVAYITHPLTVGVMLSRAGVSEDVVIAGILHDTIEDSVKTKKVSYDMIKQRFGKRVADLVDSVTEHDRTASWEERKREAFDHIASFSHGSILVKAADTLANVADILDDHARLGDATFNVFHGRKERIIANYAAVMAELNKRWPKNPLAADLRRLRRDLLRLA